MHRYPFALSADTPDAEKVEEAFTRAATWLHKKNDFTPEMLNEQPVRSLIDQTVEYLNNAIHYGLGDSKADETLTERLRNSTYMFSGFKTFHEMKEAAHLLVDEKGNRKPFERYLNDVQKINETYNKHYLKAEYEFASGSAMMAAKWDELTQDEERYNLQYRTVGDNKVRKAHKELDGITLPASDPFWDSYYPPNGWACRCSVAKVRKSKYSQSDSSDSIKKGNEATAGKHQEMFRFNPGKQQAAYPAYNSYTIKKCSTCSKEGFTLAKVPNNELCQACGVIREMKKEREKARNQYEAYDQKWRKEYFNEENGGYLVTEESRYTYGNRNKQEKAKYDKEREMCLTYARAGYRIEHLGEIPGVSSPDVTINGIPADLKRTKGGGNIVKYAKKAIAKQGAKMVLFQFDEWNEIIRKELITLKRENIEVKYFITGDSEIHSM